ncbi:cyclin b3 [Raphanus sativus]|uniref:Cyclin-B3-1 isoform X1 n=1 Tax=Raphanus sativus TaxID=3726 RepID=A0A6J0KP02_RAPSA|nr:putative cyclin-B3-1 isoform X1 [Raphanus sativus]KAJ4879369.1 cyclin b3 [Raphanus sativus]
MAFAKAPRLSNDDIFGNRAVNRSFKFYSDNQKTDPACKVGVANKTRVPLRKKSVTISSGATSNTNKTKKENSRITGQEKSSNEISEKNTKVTRKVLADLSNLGGNTLRPTLSGNNTVKWKGVKCSNPRRISVGTTRVNDTSLKNSTKVNESKRITEVGNNGIYKTDQKIIRNRTLSLGSTAGGTRKSLPVFKRTSLTNKNTKKENASSLDSKQLGQGPASKVGNRSLPQQSSVRSYTWRTRASVGSIPSDLNNQSKNNVRIRRKSIKIQTTLKTSLQNRSPLKKPPVGRSKSGSVSSIPSTEEAASALSLPEQVETKGLKEDTQEGSSSNEKTDQVTKVLDVTARPKSKRRKSFTSLLVAGSKFDGKSDETEQQEKLPSIDDESNQLEVAEYVDDIYQFYWNAEALNPALGYYLPTQTKVSPMTRGILINWLIEVHFKFHLMHETLYLTMNLLDRYLSQVPIQKNEMQLIGLTALLLASKYEDYWHPRIKDLISISAEAYTRQQILGMERIMLKQLKFRLNEATPYVFMLRFLKAARSNKKLEQLAFYLIELCLVEYEALKFKPSMLCASAIYVARCTLRMTPVWTPLLNNHTHYNVSQMKDCSDMILGFHKAAKTGKLRVTYDKYMSPDRSNIALLKPLDKLPL